MMTARVDLDALKRIPLERIAVRWGYQRDAAASTRSYPVLRAEGRPKLVLRQNTNGHWLYFNTGDNTDRGTAVDFLLQRGCTFTDMRHLVTSLAPSLATANTATVVPPRPAFQTVEAVWNAAVDDQRPPALLARGITPETLDACRPRIRRDRSGRVLFAHRHYHRLTGFEIAPPDRRRRFATGGTRSLFAVWAGPARALHTLIITEAAIDALSLAQIDLCPPGSAFLSTAGAPSNHQRQQIRNAFLHRPHLTTLVLAQDGDDAGDRQAEALAALPGLPARVNTVRRRPPQDCDWNDLIRPRTAATADAGG